jgi:hypothetical protein
MGGTPRRTLRDGTIDQKGDTRRYTIWISDDADRVPVQMIAHTDYGDKQVPLAPLIARSVCHEHDGETLLRVCPPERAVGSVPVEVAGTAHDASSAA